MAQREIGQLRTRLAWEDEGATRSLTRFRDDMKGLRSEMRTITSQGKDYRNSLKGLKQQSDVLSRQYRTQQERVKELNRRYQESVKVKGEDNKQTRNLATQVNNATAEMNRMEGQLERVNAEIQRMEDPWLKLSDRMSSTGEKLQDVGRNMTDFGKTYSMRVTAPIVAGGVAMFKASMDYESAFAGVRKTVDDTEEGYQRLSQGIRDMAKELPASATEIAGVAEAAGQLGIENDSILSFTRTIIDLGEATNLSLDQASSEFARFANITQMSQKDFDRLGSSVVSLGNTMATTESEIMSMSMRLAAQGSQVGMTEAEIVALAGTMSSLGIEAEAGGTAMTMVLKKIDAAVGESGEELAAFAKAAGTSSSEFAKVWENEPIEALDMFIKGLAASGEEGENLSAILGDLGIKGIRESDTMLRLAGASDLLADAVNTSSAAWEENSALTAEAEERYATTESQLRMMWNRIKDVAISIGDALVPAVMDAIDAAEPLIEKIESSAQAFADMDEEQQRTILKMAGLVAAIGPASIALGGMVSTLGGLLKIGGNVTGMLGKASAGGKGTGLLGGIAMLGPAKATPVGLAVLGVAGLAAGAAYLYSNLRELHDVSTETADAMMDQYQANIPMIESFDELRRKSRLTNDEFARYLDLQSLLESESDPDAITAIKDEMEQLQEKSGLSNEELNKMVGYNNDLTAAIPEATTEVTEQGNRVADTTDKLREYNQEIANMARRELESELQKSLANEIELREQIKEEQVELNRLTELESGLRDVVKAKQDGTIDSLRETLIAEQENIEEVIREQQMRGDVSQELLNQQDNIWRLIELSGMDLDVVRETLGETINTVDAQRDLITEKENDLNKTAEIVDKMVEYELIAAGIEEQTARQVVQDAEVSGLLDDQLQALQDQKKELENQYPAAMQMTDEYKEAKKNIDDQIAKLQTAKGNIIDLIGEAGEYNKELSRDIDKMVRVNTDPTPSALDSQLTRTLVRNINIRTNLPQAIPAYATGTDSHAGGAFIAGEAGWELGRLGSRWEVLNAGLYDRPRGYEVFPHAESKRILSALNNIPAYATGARPSGETNRVINSMNNAMGDSGQVIALLRDIAQGVREGKVVHVSSQVITDAVNETNAVNELGNYF